MYGQIDMPKPDSEKDSVDVMMEAQNSEKEFVAEMKETPKPALSNTSESSTQNHDDKAPSKTEGIELDSTVSGSNSSMFGDGFFKQAFGANEQDVNAEQEPEPKKQIFPDDELPKEEPKNNVPPINIDSDAMDNYMFVEELKNGAMAMLLGWRSMTPSDNWVLPEETVQRMAKAASKMKVKFIEDMGGGTQYFAINAMTYAPMFAKAEMIGRENRRYAKEAANVTPDSNMTDSVNKTVPFNPAVNTNSPMGAKGERTRYELHTDGTYAYPLKYEGVKCEYIKKGSPVCAKPDLTNKEELKHIILKNGGWKKTARLLSLTDEWMQSRGLDNDKPTLKD